jgi:hypothetical protein
MDAKDEFLDGLLTKAQEEKAAAQAKKAEQAKRTEERRLLAMEVVNRVIQPVVEEYVQKLQSRGVLAHITDTAARPHPQCGFSIEDRGEYQGGTLLFTADESLNAFHDRYTVAAHSSSGPHTKIGDITPGTIDARIKSFLSVALTPHGNRR